MLNQQVLASFNDHQQHITNEQWFYNCSVMQRILYKSRLFCSANGRNIRNNQQNTSQLNTTNNSTLNGHIGQFDCAR